MRVNIEEVELLSDRRREINKPELDDIEWYKDGKKLDIPQGRINDFMFTGLNNIDFITTKEYLRPAEK